MADKHFKVKNNVQVSDLTTAGPVTVDANGVLASHATLAIDKGGTGQTTAANAINALLPSQTSNTSKILGTDGTNVTWVNPGASYQTSAPSNPVTGQLWVDSDETGDSLDPYIIRRKTITATAGQTVFTTDVVFTDGYEQVYYNGVLLVRTTDYTTSGGTNTVTLLQGASAGDTVEIIASTPINLVNSAVLVGNNTFTGNQTIQGTLNATGNAANKVNISSKFTVDTSNAWGAISLARYSGQIDVLKIQGTDATGTANVLRLVNGSGNGSALDLYHDSLRFYVEGTTTERMRIDASGRVGIGTSSPSSTLHVAGGAGSTIRNTASSGSSWFVGSNVDSMIIHNESNTPMVFTTNGTERMRIHSDGNVSIGTTVNSGKLLISSGNPTTELNIRAYDDATKMATIQADNNVLRLISRWTGGTGGLITFHTGQPVAQRMMINANGNVGVGWSPDNNWHLSVNSSGAVGAGAFLSTTSDNILAGLFEATKSDYSNVILKLGAYRAANSVYTFIQALSGTYADAEFNLRGDGQAYADGSWNAGGADYAEYFEWLDGNTDNEDRRGYSVSLLNDKIKICEEGDVPVGVISGNPSVVGDSGWNKWNGKYLVDRFGSYIKDENGERVLNPEYDPEAEYVSREDRPEWAIVGLMGKLRLRKGQVTGAGWIKMKDIDQDTEEWLVK